MESQRFIKFRYYVLQGTIIFIYLCSVYGFPGMDRLGKTAAFLEDALRQLGLTDKEANEFIIYWLPILEANEYNYIRFATAEEIEANMSLNITPAPDSLIRVVMVFKGLKEPIEVNEQVLTTPERVGFTVVEWGGTEIK